MSSHNMTDPNSDRMYFQRLPASSVDMEGQADGQPL